VGVRWNVVWASPFFTGEHCAGTQAERSDGRLVLKWNREADVVRDAQQATLTIADGDHTEEVPVDLGQLRGGSVVYVPITSDVSFRLEVVSRQGESRSESVRAFLARRP